MVPPIQLRLLSFTILLLCCYLGFSHGKHWGDSGMTTVPSQNYKPCGSKQCVDEADCNNGTSSCRCPSGTIGHGHIQCADPAKTCLCTIWGDPHVITFQGKSFRLLLPCSHVIAELTTPSTREIPRGCQLFISGRAWYPDGGVVDSLITYETVVYITLYTKNSKFTTRIGEDGFSETDLSLRESSGGKSRRRRDAVSGGESDSGSTSVDIDADIDADIDVQTDTDAAKFHRVIVPACGVIVKFRPKDGLFSLVTPTRTKDHKGICRKCKNKWNAPASDNPEETPLEVLKLLLVSLHSTSPIDNIDTNIYPSCTELTEKVRDCPANKRKNAEGFCGEMLYTGDVRKCLSRKLGKKKVLERFTQCFGAVCEGQSTCDEFRQMFSDCGDEAHLTKYLNKSNIC